jgi:hypothetical protein
MVAKSGPHSGSAIVAGWRHSTREAYAPQTAEFVNVCDPYWACRVGVMPNPYNLRLRGVEESL